MTDISWLRTRLQDAYGAETTEQIWRGYGVERPVTFRANLLKTDANTIYTLLRSRDRIERISWCEYAFQLPNVQEEQLMQTAIYQNGEIYLQSLSSMLPPIFLDPKEGETILDMTAAPGGKTTQMSAISKGLAFITAVERDHIRAERLRYNIEKQGAPRITVLETDALKLDDFFKFDKILLDAPCSGSGTVQLHKKVNISQSLVENSVRLQEKLLFKALKHLKSGGTLVYSTCAVLPCENEQIVEKALKNNLAELIPITAPKEIPTLPAKEGTLCVCPDALFEGFFVAKLRKK